MPTGSGPGRPRRQGRPDPRARTGAGGCSRGPDGHWFGPGCCRSHDRAGGRASGRAPTPGANDVGSRSSTSASDAAPMLAKTSTGREVTAPFPSGARLSPNVTEASFGRVRRTAETSRTTPTPATIAPETTPRACSAAVGANAAVTEMSRPSTSRPAVCITVTVGDNVAQLSASPDQVGRHDGLAVPGQERVTRAEQHREHDREQADADSDMPAADHPVEGVRQLVQLAHGHTGDRDHSCRRIAGGGGTRNHMQDRRALVQRRGQQVVGIAEQGVADALRRHRRVRQ